MFFMQAGFAVLCAGCVRSKNVQNTLMKNFLDACGAAIGFWSVGYALAFGETSDASEITFIGRHGFFMNGVDNYALWLFNFAFAATAATIVAGTLAERCQMISYLAYSAILTGFVYPVVVHSVWSMNGFLSPHIVDPLWGTGMIDFAGSGVVHVTGGVTAFLAAFILGPRKGRFYDESGATIENPKKIQGHSVSLQVNTFQSLLVSFSLLSENSHLSLSFM
jgi:Amt family ammonium transporter